MTLALALALSTATPAEAASLLGGDFIQIGYDDEGNGRAGRLVWTLDAIGHGPAAIMDGGFGAWREAGLEVEHGAVNPPPRTRYPVNFERGRYERADNDLEEWLEEDAGDAPDPALYRWALELRFVQVGDHVDRVGDVGVVGHL